MPDYQRCDHCHMLVSRSDLWQGKRWCPDCLPPRGLDAVLESTVASSLGYFDSQARARAKLRELGGSPLPQPKISSEDLEEILRGV